MGGLFRSSSRRKPQSGFTLLEVLIALGILTFGLLGLLVILQDTLLKTEPVEFETKAALIAQSILDGIRSDPSGFPFVPGLNPGTWPMVDTSSRIYEEDGYLLGRDAGGSNIPYQLALAVPAAPFMVFNVPGDGADNDAQFDELSSGSLAVSRWRDDFVPGVPNNGIDNQMDRLFTGSAGAGSRRDYDGTIEDDVASLYLGIGSLQFPPQDRDGDGFVTISGTIFKDSGDSSFVPNGNFVSFGEAMNHPGAGGVGGGVGQPYRPDGDFSYDPQRGLDEELPDGRDNDGDTLVDEDTALASQLRNISGVSLQNPYSFVPHLAGNGLDDDGDSEDFTDLNGNGLPDVSIPNIQPEAEEGVDPQSGKVYADGIDNNPDAKREDGGGAIDERIDEELYDGLDNDSDGLIDEDCRAATFPFKPIPLPKPNEDYSFQISARRVPAGGDGVDNDGDNAQRVSEGRDYNLNGTAGDPAEGIDEEFFDGIDDDRDGLVDEDVKAYAAPNTLLVTVSIFRGDDRIDNDGDGYIDEEPVDGIDNDFDVNVQDPIDEDFYVDVFRTSGLVTFSE